MIAICKENTFASNDFGGDLLFIKNKEYFVLSKTNNDCDYTTYRINCETDYNFSFRENTFHAIFYTDKELRKIKLEKIRDCNL